jgi:hypothetical protein
MLRWLTFSAMSVLALTASAAEDVVLELPAGYKTSFDNYLTADRLNQEDQVIVLYANSIARTGARSDGKLPFGSVLVGEIYKAKTDVDGTIVESQLGRRIPSELSAIVMMERRDGWDDQYPDELKVGDWEFEVFSPTGDNLGKDTTACRECHHPLTDSEFVWSYEHIGGVN